MHATDAQIIYLVPPGAAAAAEASLSNRAVIRPEFSEVRTLHELVSQLSAAFEFPHHASGLDAALDLMSDLDWMHNDSGYLLVTTGLSELRSRAPEVATAFVHLLPFLCERWRDRDVAFAVLLVDGRESLTWARSVLDDANGSILRARRRPWLARMRAVPISD
jgi:hypothetical protein